MIVAVQDGGTLHVAAFIMGQSSARTSPVMDHLTTMDDVGQRTGLDFLWQLPDAEEDTVEAVKNAACVQGWIN